MIKYLLLFLISIVNLMSIDGLGTICPAGEKYNLIHKECRPVSCNENESYDIDAGMCLCHDVAVINGTCGNLVSNETCETFLFEYIKDYPDCIDYGFDLSGHEFYMTYNSKCYSNGGSFSLKCNTPVITSNIVEDITTPFYNPYTGDLNGSEKALIDEFVYGNKAILNQNVTLKELKNESLLSNAYSQANLIQNSDVHSELSKMNINIRTLDNKDLLKKGFGAVNKNLEDTNKILLASLDRNITIDSNITVDMNITNNHLSNIQATNLALLEDSNKSLKIQNDNNDMLSSLFDKDSSDIKGIDTKIKNLNDPMEIQKKLDSFKIEFTSKLQEIYNENLNSLGFGDYAVSSVPAPITLTFYGTTYELLNLSIIPTSTIELIRNMFIFFAHITGFILIFKGGI